MLRRFFSITITASILAVVVGVGWIAFGEVSKSDAAHADASFSKRVCEKFKLGWC